MAAESIIMAALAMHPLMLPASVPVWGQQCPIGVQLINLYARRWRTAIAVCGVLLSATSVQAAPARLASQQVVNLSATASITLQIQEFAPPRHRLIYCKPQRLCLIDGYPIFGTEGAVPRLQVISLVLTLDGKRIPLEHRGMFNPWSPVEGEALPIRIVEASGNGLRIRGVFSDGSAAYMTEWLVLKGRAARVLIDCVECVAAYGLRDLDSKLR